MKLIVLLVACLLMSTSISYAQAGSANYKLTSGTVVGGGGNSASAGNKVAGGIPSTTGGVSSSNSYILTGGVAAVTLASKFITDVEEIHGTDLLPIEFTLDQNYPNPFNPHTVIGFALPEPEHVRLDIFNILGQRVRRLIDFDMPPGWHATTWDSRNDEGVSVASGVYLYVLSAGDNSVTRKMLMLK
ncbi:MAG: T9SS C-terminal target domain-containing protein [Candidatus Zixiibacteriota bacterium]|nr:MAG: T9SS C-terminal target domain-containing protein [candidate division Zixibacteria bacterium]